LQVVLKKNNAPLNTFAMKLDMASLALICASVSRGTVAFTRSPQLRKAILPSSSNLRFSTSSDNVPHLRRLRPSPNPATLERKASQLPNYQEGTLRSTTEDRTDTTAAEPPPASVPEPRFPNAGKSVLDLPPRMRFAPSPTGSLHVGGARTALYNWLVAKKGQLDVRGGEGGFVLRVEDTDLARSTKESEDSVLADLSWLGLTWDEGPDMPLAKYGPYRQSERSSLYSRMAQGLIDEGKAYPCFCTAEELEEMKARMEAEGEPPRYDGTWRDADPALVREKIAAGDPYTVRFKVPPGARVVIKDVVRDTVSWDADSTVGDFILLRSSGVPVYNFCVAVDDASMGITTVVRAEEHLTNTLRQVLVLDALGAPRPQYAHCSLILGEDRQKLSKRHGATSCDQFRVDGFLPDAMINYLALLGWNDGTENEIFSRDELVDAFSMNRIVRSPSVFDMDKLRWVNSQHLKGMAVEDILGLVEEQLRSMNMIREGVDEGSVRDFVFASTTLAKQMMETLQDAASNAKTVLGYNLPSGFDELDSEARELVVMGNFHGIAAKLLEMHDSHTFPQPDPSNLLAAFVDGSNRAIVEDTQVGGDGKLYPQEYKSMMKQIAKENQVKGKCLFHPARLALTGEMSGQEVTKQLSLLAMAASDGSAVNVESAGVVPFDERMERLRSFCETIPEEFRSKPDSRSEEARGSAKDTSKGKSAASMAETAAPAAADPLDSYAGPPITALDIRVGRINRVWVHEDADKLYCEEIDVGEDEPRLIASGLRPYLSPEDLDGRLVLVLCNLKTRKLAGFPSHGMVLCASNEDHTVVKLCSVPVDAAVGERVTVPGVDFDAEGSEPAKENRVGKKKVFEKIAPYLKTSEHGVPEFCGRPLMTSAGVCTSPICDGSVS